MVLEASRKNLRVTWIGFGSIFALLGTISFFKDGGAWRILYPLAGAFLVASLTLPRFLLPLFRLWARFAGIMAFLNTRLLLSIVYYGLITPIGVGLRLLGRDPLDERWDPDRKTYWTRRSAPTRDPRDYDSMF